MFNNSFGKNIIPDNELMRLHALDYYNVLGSLPDSYFNNLAYIIAETFNTSIALITFVSADKVDYKGNAGMEGTDSVPRGISLCSLAILDGDVTVFSDAIKEPCLLGNPLVVGDFGLRFYAGAPVVTKEGFHIGTVCVVSKQAREFSNNEKEILKQFANNVMLELEMRKDLHLQQGEG